MTNPKPNADTRPSESGQCPPRAVFSDPPTDFHGWLREWLKGGHPTIAMPRGFVEAMLHEFDAAERQTIERCAKVAEGYGREGDRLSKEFACEVADELAARIRSLTQTGEK